jgi:hypothetical protein
VDTLKLADAIMSHDLYYSILVSILFVVFNLGKIVAFFDARRKIRIDSLKASLENIDEENITAKHLREVLMAERFKIATGIYIENPKRDKLLDVYKKISWCVSFDVIKKALPYIKLNINNEVVVDIRFIDKAASFFNFILFVYMSTLALFLISSFRNYASITLAYIIICLAATLLFFSIAILALYLNIPFISAIKLKKILSNVNI